MYYLGAWLPFCVYVCVCVCMHDKGNSLANLNTAVTSLQPQAIKMDSVIHAYRTI